MYQNLIVTLPKCKLKVCAIFFAKKCSEKLDFFSEHNFLSHLFAIFYTFLHSFKWIIKNNKPH